jgi:hypothetical protein
MGYKPIVSFIQCGEADRLPRSWQHRGSDHSTETGDSNSCYQRLRVANSREKFTRFNTEKVCQLLQQVQIEMPK